MSDERDLVAQSDRELVARSATDLLQHLGGLKHARAVRDAGFAVIPVPGPNAVVTALSACSV